MKYVILICDGAADYPIEKLGGKTVLQAANTPNLDKIAKEGRNGLAITVPEGYVAGSDVANLSIMGYDPDLYFPGGRGVIEAAATGIDVSVDEVPMRANIITVEGGKIIDYSAGNIKNEESKALIEAANKAFGSDTIQFYPGVSYRNLVVVKDEHIKPGDFTFHAPHDHPGEKVDDYLCSGEGDAGEWAKKLNSIMLESQNVFEEHEVNKKREEEGKKPANMLWFWGPGKKKRDMPTIKERFGLEGVVITGIDLIKGLGKLAGLEALNVEGATAYYDTDYEGKAEAAINALNGGADIAIIHVEAPDEAGHEGKLEEKVRAVENIDKRLLLKVLEGVEDDLRIAILPDHYTPISTRKHEMDAIPFAIMGPGIEKDSVKTFDEESSKEGSFGTVEGYKLIELLIKQGGSD